MKAGHLPSLLALAFLIAPVRAADSKDASTTALIPTAATPAAATATAGAAGSLDDALKQAALRYGGRLQTANDELTRTRERIAREKTPLLQALRAAEDRIIAAEAEMTRLDTAQEQSQENRRRMARDSDTLRKNESYICTLAHDGLKAFGDGLVPGEEQVVRSRLTPLLQPFEDPSKTAGTGAAADAADFLLARVERSLGGYLAVGSSMVEGDNRLVKGTFAFVGPESFFLPEAGGPASTVRMREGTPRPVAYSLPAWKPEAAAAFFQGKPGTIMADASAGKALRLRETKGTLWQHVNKGGVVAYAILGVGLLAALMTLQKVRDLARMKADRPEVVERFLTGVAGGARAEAEQALGSLRETTREVFTTGLRYIDQPKAILEEHLTAVVLRQRLHYERWLPLLAVIATAAPLMGLLGTVTGLVRTFALITVFGTGNAGKLASGISEVLVATELGLMVAIPTLVAHGFLSHRIQKNLSLLERYALEFVTAARAPRPGAEGKDQAAP